MIRYSIAVCNYNMADTLKKSLRSILDQIDERFEVVVIDGGSDDDSVRILRDLSMEYGALRVVRLDSDPSRHLGADRQRSIEEARGDYVLPQLDADDRYLPILSDFVELYQQLSSEIDSFFYLSGKGLNIGPRELLVDVPYRNIRSGEDRDLWRRLFAEESIIWLQHAEVREEIGYHFDLREQLQRDYEVKVCDFQAGLDFWSCMRWALTQESHGIFTRHRAGLKRVAKTVYDLATFPLAYLDARNRPQYDTPSKLQKRGTLERAIADNRMTLSEIEETYDISLDRSALSDLGREKLDL
jgi:hypothetical protein